MQISSSLLVSLSLLTLCFSPLATLHFSHKQYWTCSWQQRSVTGDLEGYEYK